MRFAGRVIGASLLVVGTTTILVDQQIAGTLATARRADLEARLHEDTAACRAMLAQVLSGPAQSASLEQRRALLAPVAAELAAALPGRQITVVAVDGTVLADSQQDAAVLDNHGRRPEILAPGTIAQRFQHAERRPMLYLALPLPSGEGSSGWIRVARGAGDGGPLESALRRALWVGSAVAALALGLVLTWLSTRHVALPLARVTEAVSAVGRGEDQRHFPPAGPDDIGRLAEALDGMVARLRQREERIVAEVGQKEAILSAMDEGVLAVDAREQVVLANDAARRILQRPDEPLVGRRLSEVTRVPEILESTARCLAARERVVHEFTHAGPAGVRIVLLSANPLRKSEGGAGLCVLVLHDLTEVRRLERVRRDFVANVSHELKTPLTSMQGYLEAIAEDSEMPAAQRSAFLSKARTNTDRLAAIVRDLLELARLEAGRGALRREFVELNAVVRACVETAREAAAPRGVRVDSALAEAALALRGDERALGTAVGNLLDNAVKYSPQGGVVTVRTWGQDGSAWVEVRDQGPGIPAHETERIFERFYRVEKGRGRTVGGTGLGLSIVRNVARVHGGEVAVVSAIGVGSSFRLRLPLEVSSA